VGPSHRRIECLHAGTTGDGLTATARRMRSSRRFPRIVAQQRRPLGPAHFRWSQQILGAFAQDIFHAVPRLVVSSARAVIAGQLRRHNLETTWRRAAHRHNKPSLPDRSERWSARAPRPSTISDR